MFINLNIFKKKEDSSGYAELGRKNRVERKHRKLAKRPRSAPGPPDMPSDFRQALESRRSLQYDMPLNDEPLQEPMLPYAAPRLPTPRDELPRPLMGRSFSSASCAIRNPFRHNTNDSVTTISQVSELSESVDPIPQMVPSYTPMQRMSFPGVAPQKASIFTSFDPFADTSDESDSDTPTTPSPPTATRSTSLSRRKGSPSPIPIRPGLRQSSHDIPSSRFPSGVTFP